MPKDGSVCRNISTAPRLLSGVSGCLLQRRLRQTGVRLSLEDSGTGFASIILLHQLPFHQIRIDRSFIRGLLKDRRAAEIVSDVIQLSRAIGLNVIAEGMETQAQMEWLRHNNCQAARGCVFGRPAPVAR